MQLLRLGVPLVLGLACLIGCAEPEDNEPTSQIKLALGIPIELVGLEYDSVQGIITPCGAVPTGIHTAALKGHADFVVEFEASYTSLGEAVTPCGGFFLSSLKGVPYDQGRVVVEMFLPAPPPDEINSVVATLSIVQAPGEADIILDQQAN
jgi:hypothetical protein